MMRQIIMQTKQLNKQYGNHYAVKNVDFQLFSGDICALIGSNGAGKSTLFKLLSGQVLPTSGEIEIFKETGKGLFDSRKRVSFMIETPAFFDNFTAEENLEYFRRQRGIPDKASIHRVLQTVDLLKHTKKKYREYSLGMKQRLGLALCLLSSPDCLVLDEPTNGLDAQGINDIRRLLLKINKEDRVTIFISSHILSELQSIASRFVFIKEGSLLLDLTKKELEEKSTKRIKIKVDAPQKAVNVLERGFPNITYTVLPDNWIIVSNYVNRSAEINTALTQNDIQVFHFAIEGEDLETFFLKLIGGEQND